MAGTTDGEGMKNLGRVLRVATQQRLLVAATLFCALMVGILWGGNITAVYPFAAVTFGGQPLQEWVADEIAKSEATLADLTIQREALKEQLASAISEKQEELRRQIGLLKGRISAEQAAIARFRMAQPYVDNYLPHTPFATLVALTCMLLLGTVLKSAFFIAHSVLVARLAQRATFKIRNQFFRNSLRMDLSSFDVDGSAELMSRFTYDMENLSAGLRNLFGKATREPLKMVVCFVGAGWICWRLLVLSLIVAPLAALLIGWLAKTLKRANRRAMEEMSQLYGVLEETFQGIKVVKAFTMERYERHRFHDNSKKYYKKALKIARYDALTRPLTELMGIASICMAILAGAYLVINQQTHLFGIIRISYRPLEISQLMVFYALLAGVSDPARKISDVFTRITRAAAASDRIYALIDREPKVRDPEKPMPLGQLSRALAIKNISFAYNPSTPVLQNIDLTIAAGETVAIVGPNGCGKSTLVNLIPRFFDPDEGAVLIDGTNIRHARVRDIRRQIGVVNQETLLFDDTVENNIRYGTPSATREQVIEAAKAAHAHRFIIEQLEDGYDTLVGPRGGMISGGQRQRIALARAILRDPAILILDEATSQVDLESEQVIHRVIEQFICHRTALIITHRLSTLTLANRIVVMDEGRILDVGSHDQLMARCVLYQRLHKIQFKQSA